MLRLLLISVVFCVFERWGVSLLSSHIHVCVCVCVREICVFLAGRGEGGLEFLSGLKWPLYRLQHQRCRADHPEGNTAVCMLRYGCKLCCMGWGVWSSERAIHRERDFGGVCEKWGMGRLKQALGFKATVRVFLVCLHYSVAFSDVVKPPAHRALWNLFYFSPNSSSFFPFYSGFCFFLQFSGPRFNG